MIINLLDLWVKATTGKYLHYFVNTSFLLNNVLNIIIDYSCKILCLYPCDKEVVIVERSGKKYLPNWNISCNLEGKALKNDVTKLNYHAIVLSERRV